MNQDGERPPAGDRSEPAHETGLPRENGHWQGAPEANQGAAELDGPDPPARPLPKARRARERAKRLKAKLARAEVERRAREQQAEAERRVKDQQARAAHREKIQRAKVERRAKAQRTQEKAKILANEQRRHEAELRRQAAEQQRLEQKRLARAPAPSAPPVWQVSTLPWSARVRQHPLQRAMAQGYRALGASPCRQAAQARHSDFLARSARYRQVVEQGEARLASFSGNQVEIANTRWWVPADLRQPDGFADRIVRRGWLRWDEILWARDRAHGTVMIDIGANIGTTSIPRVLLRDFEYIYAAEPESKNSWRTTRSAAATSRRTSRLEPITEASRCHAVPSIAVSRSSRSTWTV
jgi:hypothetical protein